MKPVIMVGLLLVVMLGSSYTLDRDFDTRLKSIVKPYHFSVAGWELKALAGEVSQRFSGEPQKIDDETGTVNNYFATTQRIRTLKATIAAANSDISESDLALLRAELTKLEVGKTASARIVERIIARQIKETLAEQGIFNPMSRLKFSFPPVSFQLKKPPSLLVVSPRDKIESIREITLQPNLALEEMETIEGQVDELKVSSLVVELGGLGATYPTLVNSESSLRSTIDAATEEWLHQYLVFKPLGFRYLLDVTGLSRNYEIATINEALAGMVSQEIGSLVYEKYYAASVNGTGLPQPPPPATDFSRQMREIRKIVDDYLSQGAIEPAEEFMAQQRQLLAARGYHLRKLNQAYFAFHGTYADQPAFLNPIGVELNQLRAQSASLKDFLRTAAAITSRQDLSKRAGKTPAE